MPYLSHRWSPRTPPARCRRPWRSAGGCCPGGPWGPPVPAPPTRPTPRTRCPRSWPGRPGWRRRRFEYLWREKRGGAQGICSPRPPVGMYSCSKLLLHAVTCRRSRRTELTELGQNPLSLSFSGRIGLILSLAPLATSAFSLSPFPSSSSLRSTSALKELESLLYSRPPYSRSSSSSSLPYTILKHERQ